MEKTWADIIIKPKQGMKFRVMISQLMNVLVYFG